MASSMRLEIITPGKSVFAQDVYMVIGRALDGDLGILPGHTPLIAALQVWPLRVFLTEEEEIQISLCSGFMEVKPEGVTILASCAELKEEIDVERAQAAKERAERRLQEKNSELDALRAELSLRRAVMRLQVARFSDGK